MRHILSTVLAAIVFAGRAAAADIAIEIDLTAQKACLFHDGARIYSTPISTGRAGYRTRTGDFKVVQKDEDHVSSLYGKIVDSSGRTVEASADRGMPVPAGGKFIAAPMHHFLRFDGAVGMHAGYLPGYPASHGCVRLPPDKAALFYNIAEVGTPVRVYGTAPDKGPPARVPKFVALPAAPAATPPPQKAWLEIFRRTSPRTAQQQIQTRPGNESGPR
jgi:hypothetical protein